MEPALDKMSWTRGEATFIADKKNAKQSYFFRDLKASIRFLIEQPCFKDFMSYAPVKQYSSPDVEAEGTMRFYTEPNSGEYWEKEQVCNEVL